MNFAIILKMIYIYILSNTSGTYIDFVDCGIENMDLRQVFNKYLSSSILCNNPEHPSNGHHEIYCKCDYQSPLLVLGKSFNPSYMMKMCEMQMIRHADVLRHVKFTLRGTHVCNSVCKVSVHNIKTQHKNCPLKVKLLENFCDLIDKSFETKNYFETQCVCVFHIKINNWQTVIVYKYNTNPNGLVKVESH